MALLRIVAGPGAAVDIAPPITPPGQPWMRRDPTPVVDVFRVQDPDAVPPMATDIDPSLYTTVEGYGAFVRMPSELIVRSTTGPAPN